MSLLFVAKINISLHYQIETETGSAGEQPVRDKFDELTEM
jgi:hypothetical protein